MKATATATGGAAGTFVTRCRCGRDKTDLLVRPVKRYGLWAAMALMMGYTARPMRIDIVCPTCGALFNSITDSAELERFRYGEPGPDER